MITESRGGSAAPLSLVKRLVLAIVSSTAMLASMPGCAAERAYNPDALGNAQFEVVADICQSVMGLDPTEPLIGGGVFVGAARLGDYTNHYQGCVLSLSDSLQRASAAEAARRAGEGCRAQGYAPGSAGPALCELNSGQSAAGAPALTKPVSQMMPPPNGSYRSASNGEHHRRENRACAALGIEPSQDEFVRCVQHLDQTLYAIDNPVY